MGSIFSFSVVIALALIAFAGAKADMHVLFGVVIPYAAVATFLGGFIYKILYWGSSPVPFRIPTTCGQEKSLPWIKQNKLENPSSTLGVIGRMALEVLLFRSLFVAQYEESQLALQRVRRTVRRASEADCRQLVGNPGDQRQRLSLHGRLLRVGIHVAA